MTELADAGAHRINLDGALNWISIGALNRPARAMLDEGRFNWMEETPDASDVRQLLG